MAGAGHYTPVARKTSGFRAAMRRHVDPALTDADLDALVASTVFTVEGGALAGRSLIDAGATGILCGSDVMALGVIRAVRQAGLRVPEDVSVVGSDDSIFNEFMDPPLTTVRQPSAAMAAAACRSLVDQIGGTPPTPEEMLFRPELVVRGSTGRAPAS